MPTEEERENARKEYRSHIVTYYGDLSDESVDKFLENKNKIESVKSPFARRKGVNASIELGENAREKFVEIIESYSNSFVDITPNDRETIKSLAMIELQLASIREQMFSGRLSGEDLRSMLEAQTSLNSEHRQLQKILGIDKKTRDDSSQNSDTVDKIDDIIKQASDFYKQKMIHLTHCGVKFGHIMCHFNDWKFVATCPKCGKEFTVFKEINIPQENNNITYVKRGRGRPRKGSNAKVVTQ